MKYYTHLLWDFNGTLFDDVEACIQSANALLGHYDMPPLASVEEYRASFGFPVIDYYKKIGFDFEKYSYADLAVEWVAYYLKYSALSTLYPDVTRALEAVKSLGISQLILSASEQGMLERQVGELGIRPYFDGLLGMQDIHAHGKEAIARRWREQNPSARVLFIGDTNHDAEVAKSIGADYILLASGHQSAERLAATKPLFVADGITDAMKRIFGITI